jgi:hypothetical protein
MPGKGWGWARDIANSRLTAIANSIEGLRFSSTGAATIPIGATVTAGGLAVTAGGLAVTAGRFREGLTLTNYTTGGAYAIPASAIAGGLVTRNPSGAGRTDTLPTGTLLEAEFTSPALVIGECITCYYINTATGAEAITLAVNTDMTISNVGQTIAQNEAVLLVFQKTVLNTFVCYILGA